MPLSHGTFPCIAFVHKADRRDWPDAPGSRAAVENFRQVLERILIDEARGLGASDDDLVALDRVLARAAQARGLVSTVRGYAWGWRREPDPVLELIYPAAWSAAELLAGDDRQRLKCCDACGRLFIDRSRNRSRRWCDMQRCGNREKARRFRKTRSKIRDR